MNTAVIDADDTIAAIVQSFAARLQNPASPLSLLAPFAVREPSREAIKSAFSGARSQTLHEPGCQIFELNEEPQNPGRFVMYERWSSLADLEAHLRKDHAVELRTLFYRLIIDGPEFQILLPTE